MTSIFLSSTCYDLRDLRAEISPFLRSLGYSVVVSDEPDFPVNSDLHNHDNCLVNVEAADVYLLIIGDRYGTTYDGRKYPQFPLQADPSRRVSVTWYEYLRAVETEKQIRILVRSDIWNQLPVFEAIRQANADLKRITEATRVQPELLDFIHYVLSLTRRNWIHEFHNVMDAKEILQKQLGPIVAADARAFRREVAELLRLNRYNVTDHVSGEDDCFHVETGDPFLRLRVVVHCIFCRDGRLVSEKEVETAGYGSAATARTHILVVTNTDFDPSIRPAANVRLVTRTDLLRRLVDFRPYVEHVKNDYDNYSSLRPSRYLPIGTDLKKHFVRLECEGDYKGDLFEAVAEFLRSPEENHLTILGDFGTGKSASMIELTRKMLADDSTGRIPLFFSLRNYVHLDSLQSVVQKALVQHYGVPPFDYVSFQKLLEEGKLLLIFDGFDEMATLSERWVSVGNLRRLNEAVGPRTKVILTCRTHYFTSQNAEREQIGGSLGAEVAGRRNFAIIYLCPFSSVQITEFVQKHCPDEAADYLLQIHRLPGLDDLAKRPVLLEMILRTLPELIKSSRKINLATLYREFTNRWLRDVAGEGVTLARDDKLTFTRALAIKLYQSDRPSIHHQELMTYVGEFFQKRLRTAADSYLFDQEIRTCDFLNRDHEGNYQFVHRSFLEYFAATEVNSALAKNMNSEIFSGMEASPEIQNFVAQCASEDPKVLDRLCLWAFDKTGVLSWNAIGVLPFLKDLCSNDAAESLTRLCEDQGLRSGVAWVLGELGVRTERIEALLKAGLKEPAHHTRWWECSFALHKLGVYPDPVGELIATLPETWSYEKSVNHFRATFAIAKTTTTPVDQRDVVGILKEWRRCDRASQVVDMVREILRDFSVASDVAGRRAYYAVWLLGELRVKSELLRLLEVVEHPLASVRNMLAEALGKIGRVDLATEQTVIGEGGLEVLRRLLCDSYYRARLHAARSIGWVCGRDLAADLEAASRREWLGDVRREIAKALERLA